MLCNGDYTNWKYETANLPCLRLCNCKYKNTISITNGLATCNVLAQCKKYTIKGVYALK